MPPNNRKKKDLTSDQRKQIISELLLSAEMVGNEIKLTRGALAATAKNFDRDITTISRIWKTAKENKQNPVINAFRATPQKKGKCGLAQKWDREEMARAIPDIHLSKRRTLHSLASELGVPKSTLHRIKCKDDNIIIPHSNAVKPSLTDENKLSRILYAVEHCEPALDANGYRLRNAGGQLSEILFDDFENDVMVDEKWFFICEEDLHCYLTAGEEPPQRTVKHKSHIIKVMFLAAVARPCFNNLGECTFDVGCHWQANFTILLHCVPALPISQFF